MSGLRANSAPLLACIALLCACGQGSEGSADDTSDASATSTARPSPTIANPPDQDQATVSDSAQKATTPPAVTAAIEDLAARQAAQTNQIIVVELVEVTWADGAIGCPQPGMQYSQALVPGQLLILAIDTADSGSSAEPTFTYHAGRSGAFRYCADPQPPASEGSGAGDR